MEEHGIIAHAGVDIGSATVKLVVLNPAHEVIFARYERHYSQVRSTLARIMAEGHAALPLAQWNITLTGSGAIDAASALELPFVQEVVACSECIRRRLPQCDVSIELGGEDAKITFFTGGVEQRMNETCAGGTGAFIDHMARMLHTDPSGLDALACNHTTLYPIASRCGVFAKTDILPLLNEGCAREDIAASIFQAVVEQCVSGLACGRDISGTVVFLGGPLAFLGALRRRFVDALGLEEHQALFPPHAEYFVAIGAAYMSISNSTPQLCSYTVLQKRLHDFEHQASALSHCLPPLFADVEARTAFTARHAQACTPRSPIEAHQGPLFLGLDMGSTTTKAVCIDPQGTLLYTFYGPNKGEPLQAAISILREIYARMHPQAYIGAAAVTGYGSTLVRAALGVDIDEVETVAHWTAARFFLPQVSYILDIGGQDIKCLRLRDGVIDTIQLNEACSSGCGSFVESFASSLNMSLAEFVEDALRSPRPIDLGTRCTVFMNSRVKQAQKEGASVGDIAAGLSYSVIRNALYKVIKIKNIDELGQQVIAQGGAFHNDALLRALELCLGRSVLRPDIAGLMGAFGAALLARDQAPAAGRSLLRSAQSLATFTVHNTVTRCQACPNHCQLTVSRFPEGTRFVSGNRCERGAGIHTEHNALPNIVQWKYQRLFDHYQTLPLHRAPRGVVSMPRTLSMFEHYPLWFTLFNHLGFRVELSPPSSRSLYAEGCHTIPSQTLCYPAKLAHGHMMALAEKNNGSLFFPCIPLEQKQFTQQDHHYNCPVVGGYPELIAQNIDVLRQAEKNFFRPFLPMDRRKLAQRLAPLPLLHGIPKTQLQEAVNKGFAELDAFQEQVQAKGEEALAYIRQHQCMGIVLAGHPYHIDPEVHHGIPDYMSSLGIVVLTEDSVAHLAAPLPLRVVDQWTYHSRLYRAAAFVAQHPQLSLVHLVSFGCGLSALTAEQIEEILATSGQMYTQIKIDEGHNIGPARIRIRSLLASMHYRKRMPAKPAPFFAPLPPPFTPAMRSTHTIIIGHVAPFHSRLMEATFRTCGYKTATLPPIERADVEEGLRLVNNDACYPAILTVGQLVRVVRSGNFDPDKVALAVYQSGGGCRATNYYALLRKALVDCGLSHVPIISFNLQNRQNNSGFSVDWPMIKRSFMACCMADVLSRLYHRVKPYERVPGATHTLVEHWLEQCERALEQASRKSYARLLQEMVADFEALPLRDIARKPRVAIVGEILVKYHSFANNRLAQIIEDEGGEVLLPDILDFFLYCLYDDVFRHQQLAGTWQEALKSRLFRQVVEWYRAPMVTALKGSKRFSTPTPFNEMIRIGNSLVSLGHQAGEGWLLTAEMLKYLQNGVENIICVQPFGCLPNHITGKGMFREIKRRYPNANLVAIDYDQGTSETNQINRIKLMMNMAKNGEA